MAFFFQPNIPKLVKSKNISALIQVFSRNKNPQTRAEAADALIKLNAPESVPLLEAIIQKAGKPETKRDAIRILLEMETENAERLFLSEVVNTDPGKRQSLYSCTQTLSDETAIRLLSPFLETDMNNFPFLARTLLARKYTPVIDPLLTDGPPNRCTLLVRILVEMGEQGAVLLATRFLELPREKRNPTQAKRNSKSLLPFLVPYLSVFASSLRIPLIGFLLFLRKKSGTREIESFFAGNFPAGAADVLTALSDQEKPPGRSVVWVKKGLLSKNDALIEAAVSATSAFPPGYFNKPLIEALKGDDAESISWAQRCPASKANLAIIETLCLNPDEETLEALSKILDAFRENSYNNRVLGEHLIPLLEKGPPFLSKLLFSKLDSPYEKLRIPARKIAAKKKPDLLIPILVDDLNHGEEGRRKEATAFLDEMGWHPETELEKCSWAFAKGRWEELASAGKPAIPVLECMLENGIRLEWTCSTLKQLSHVPEKPETALIFHITCRDQNALVRMGRTFSLPILHVLERHADQLSNEASEAAIGALERFYPLEPEVQDKLNAFLEQMIGMERDVRNRSELICRIFDILIKNNENLMIKNLSLLLEREKYSALNQFLPEMPFLRNLDVLERILKSPYFRGETLVPFLFDIFSYKELRKSVSRVLLFLAAEHSETILHCLMDDLDKGFFEERKARIELLRDLAGSGFLSPSQWKRMNEAREKIETRHKDLGKYIPHQDYRTKDGWCIHHVDTPGSSHTDEGIGMTLPDTNPSLRLYGLPMEKNHSVRSWGMDRGRSAEDLVRVMPDASENAAKMITDAMKEGDWRRRAVAAQVIMAHHGLQVDIIALLKDPEAPVRLEAIRTISRLGLREAIPELKVCLDDPHIRIVQAAENALKSMGWKPGPEEADTFWKNALASPDFLRRIEAIRHLAANRSPGSIKTLIPMLNDSEESVRQAASRHLLDLGWKPADDSEEYARFLANAGKWDLLLEIEGEGGNEFKKALEHPPEHLDVSVFVQALLNLSSKMGKKWLKETILSGKDPAFSAELIETWGKHESLSPEFLDTLIKNEHPAIRFAAVRAAIGSDKDANGFVSQFFNVETEPEAVHSLLQIMAERKTIYCSMDLMKMAWACRELDDILRDDPKDRDRRLDTYRSQIRVFSYPAVVRTMVEKPFIESKQTLVSLAKVINGIRKVFIHSEQGKSDLMEIFQNRDIDIFPVKKGALTISVGLPPGNTLSDILEAALIHIPFIADPVFNQVDKSTAARACEQVLISTDAENSIKKIAAAIIKRLGETPQTPDAAIHFHLAGKEWEKAAQFGKSAIAPMEALAANGGVDHRDDLSAITRHIATIDHPGAFDALTRLAADQNRLTRLAAARALPRFGKKALEPLLTALQFRTGNQRKTVDIEIVSAIRSLISSHPDLLNRIRDLEKGALKHRDAAAILHQDERILPPGHKDLGGGKCLYHGDSGKIHRDTPGVPHRDFGLPFDFRL